MPCGYLLHSRPYRDSSLITTFLTDTDGRLDMVLRAGRRSTRQARTQPVPFAVYELDWAGRFELKTLRYAERIVEPVQLTGELLYCGLYLNELLHRLLPLHLPEPQLLACYRDALQQMASCSAVEPVLRSFELSLLECLGYAPDLLRDTTGLPLQAGKHYGYWVEQGLQLMDPQLALSVPAGDGAEFLAIARRDFSGESVQRLAKKLVRVALAPHLGARPLYSRELFR